MRPTLPAAIAALGVGYYLAPKEILDNEVHHTGFFQVDTKRPGHPRSRRLGHLAERCAGRNEAA